MIKQAHVKQISTTLPNLQAGWSLPFIEIILVILALLIYFWGWGILLYTVVVIILIALGTIIYDMFPVKTKAENDDITFWFVNDEGLTTIADQLVTGLQLEPYQHDYENQWEWLSTWSEDGLLELNISRIHSKRNNDVNNPIRISVSCFGNQSAEELCTVLGLRLASLLSTEIKFGTIKYIAGNEFKYVEEKVFTSEANQSL